MLWILLPSLFSFSALHDRNEIVLKNWWKESWFGAIFHLYDAALLGLLIAGLIIDFPLQNVADPILLVIHAGFRLVLFTSPYVFIFHIIHISRQYGLEHWQQLLDSQATRTLLCNEVARWKMFYWALSIVSACFSMGFTFQSPNPVGASLWLISEQIQTFCVFATVALLLFIGFIVGIIFLITSCCCSPKVIPSGNENKPLLSYLHLQTD